MAVPERRLAAIVSLDTVGYTRLMQSNERQTLRLIGRAYRGLVLPTIGVHGGEIFKTMGDGLLAEFPSAVAAVEWVAKFQRALAASIQGEPGAEGFKVRGGLALADIVVRDGDRFGEGINLAVRVQYLSPPGGMAITHGVREYLHGKTDLLFRDLGYQELKNVTGQLRVWTWQPDDVPVAPGERPPELWSTSRPSIVVLPFNNLSGDPEQDYFADGVVEEITATLSRVRDFLVIARNSAFAYKGRTVDVRQIARELGVRYVLEGSVRKSGRRLRITAQLIDAETGAHMWSDRLEGELEDVFELQDRIAEKVAGALLPSIRSAEVEKARRKRPDSLASYDLVMRALPHLWAQRMLENPEAIRLLNQALAIDPGYGLAAALGAWAHAQQIVYNWTADFEAERSEGLRLIEIASKGVGDDPTGLTALATAIMLLTGNVGHAQVFVDRALALDPNHAWAWTRRGFGNVYRGEPEAAIPCFERAMRLSPVDPFGFNCFVGMGLSHFAAGRYAEAVPWTRRALDARPGLTWPYRDLAAFLGQAGDLEGAREALALFVDGRPPISLAVIADGLRFMSADLLKRYLEGLAKAGLGE